MHPALLINEILLNIFGHCYGDGGTADPDLPRLARTCRAFHEPALDVLWEKLNDLSPLVQFLPKPYISSEEHHKAWEILRGYARRIRCLERPLSDLDDETSILLPDPPHTDPLFPNLRRLFFDSPLGSSFALHLPLPSLHSLDIVNCEPQDIASNFLEALARSSPSLGALSIRVGWCNDELDESVSNWICLWQNLHTLKCYNVALNTHALAHLSCMSALSGLSFTIDGTFHPPPSPFIFSHLQDLELDSGPLRPISLFLSSIRLPTLANFTASSNGDHPSMEEFRTFLASLETSNAPLTLQCLTLSTFSRGALEPPLSIRDLLPCTMFRDLYYLDINTAWVVDLSDGNLLTLVSSWPRLERLHINRCFGWQPQRGITLDGLLSILLARPSLCELSLAIDMQGCTERPLNESMTDLESRGDFSINVLDSVIERPSFHAAVAFFAGIASRSREFDGDAWTAGWMTKPPDWQSWKSRWKSVFKRANKNAGHFVHVQ